MIFAGENFVSRVGAVTSKEMRTCEAFVSSVDAIWPIPREPEKARLLSRNSDEKAITQWGENMRGQMATASVRGLLAFLLASFVVMASAQEPSVPALKRPIQPMHEMVSIHHAVSQPLEDLPME